MYVAVSHVAGGLTPPTTLYCFFPPPIPWTVSFGHDLRAPSIDHGDSEASSISLEMEYPVVQHEVFCFDNDENSLGTFVKRSILFLQNPMAKASDE